MSEVMNVLGDECRGDECRTIFILHSEFPKTDSFMRKLFAKSDLV